MNLELKAQPQWSADQGPAPILHLLSLARTWVGHSPLGKTVNGTATSHAETSGVTVWAGQNLSHTCLL